MRSAGNRRPRRRRHKWHVSGVTFGGLCGNESAARESALRPFPQRLRNRRSWDANDTGGRATLSIAARKIFVAVVPNCHSLKLDPLTTLVEGPINP
jgi:hypothetical protein